MRKIPVSFLSVLFAISICQAQIPSAVPWNGVVPAIFNVAGGTYDNAGSYYRYEWSFGELLLIQAFSPPDSSYLVTHGVLQPCTDIIGFSPLTLLFDKGDYKLFPNPTGGKFEIDFFIRETGMMSLQLIDATGRILETRVDHYDGCCSRIEFFDLTRYPNGMYYVVADLRPDRIRGDQIYIIRHGGMKVIKLNEK